MLIPEFLYGKYPEVRLRARKAARAIVGGASIRTVEGDLLDAAQVPGLFLVDGPSPLIAGEQFHCFALGRELGEAGLIWKDHRWRIVVDQCLEREWGVICLLGPDGTGALLDADLAQQRRFLEAVLRSWVSLTESARYSRGGQIAGRFESVAAVVLGVLRNFGEGPTPEEIAGPSTVLENTIQDRIVRALGKPPIE